MAVIGSLSVKLGLVTVEWDKATSQAKKQAKDLQSAFKDLGVDMQGLKNLFQQLGGAAGLSVAGFAAMSNSVLQLAGDLSDISKTYDVSIAKVLQFQNALVQAGGKSEDAGKIIATVFAKISDAQQGNESAIASFENLGITFQDLRNMSPEEALNRVYKGLSNIGNTYDRIKAVKEILGKSGLHKSVEEISDALGKSSAEFKRQEQALKAWADAGDRIDRMMLNLKLAFAEFFKVFVGGDFVPSVNQFKSAMVAITSVMVIGGMIKLVAAFRSLNVALKSTAALGIAIQSAQGVKGIAMAGGALAAYFGAMKVFEDQDEEASDENNTPDANKSSNNDGAGNRRTIDAMQAKLKLAKEMLRIDAERHKYQMASLTGSQDDLALAESALKFEEDIAKAKQARTDALKAENLSGAQKGEIQSTYNFDTEKADQERKQRDELINSKRKIANDAVERQINLEQKLSAIKANQANLENERATMDVFEYDKQRENYALQEKLLNIENQRQELREKFKNDTDKKSPEFQNEMARLNNAEATERQLSKIRDRDTEQERMRVQNFNKGWDHALQQYVMNSENAGKTASDIFNSFTGNMESAINNFVKTGKLSFKDLARSIIQDIIAIQMRAAASKLLGSLFGGFGGGGGSQTVGTLGSSDLMGSLAFTAANGGDVPQGKIGLVGERGPELFIPKTAGTIIPNHSLGNMGSTTNVTNNYINAIDTKSFEDRLLGSSNAIWAANQYANKSLAVNRGRA